MNRFDNFIDGEWRAPSTGRYDPNCNPAKPQDVLGEFARSEAGDVDAAVAAAKNAFSEWSEMPGPARGALLFKLADLLERDKEELGRIITLEQGKGLAEGIGEAGRAALECRFVAGEASRGYGTTFPSERAGYRVATIREPLGVVALISPWNFPVVTPIRKMAPALAYGCTVVSKPASLTPWSSVRVMELVAEAGFPKGVANLVLGGGRSVGARMVDHPDVAGISFTGSTAIGRGLYEAAARRVARVQLELGGKNPAVVWNCADLDAAAQEIVAGAFQCSGQRCTALSRVIVEESQADALVERLHARIAAMKVGDGLADPANMGPMVSLDQLEAVEEYIEIAKQAGLPMPVCGTRLSNAPERDGYFLSPTLVDHVPSDSPLAKEEIFGPVLPVIRVASLDQAVAVANDVEYGLAAAVFTDGMKTANLLQRRLEAGMIHINHGTASQSHVPFGGIKLSGEGAYSIGFTAADFYTRLKVAYTKE